MPCESTKSINLLRKTTVSEAIKSYKGKSPLHGFNSILDLILYRANGETIYDKVDLLYFHSLIYLFRLRLSKEKFVLLTFLLYSLTGRTASTYIDQRSWVVAANSAVLFRLLIILKVELQLQTLWTRYWPLFDFIFSIDYCLPITYIFKEQVIRWMELNGELIHPGIGVIHVV